VRIRLVASTTAGSGRRPRAVSGGQGLPIGDRLRGCYLKCYLDTTLFEFSRGLLHSQTRRLQAIAGLWQGHEGTERNHNPRVGGSSPSSATAPVAQAATVINKPREARGLFVFAMFIVSARSC